VVVKKIKVVLLLLLSCCAQPSFSQEDFSWWNTIHQWDGHTSWHNYLTISPGYFGPNALPIPSVGNGRTDSLFQFQVLSGGHFSQGDKTFDGILRGIAPFCGGKVCLSASVVPLEYYVMDTVTRDLRAARDRDGKGFAGGDIHIATTVQIVRDRKNIPDVTLEIALRTASGTKLGAARYTDAPGYHMDVSAGKSFMLPGKFFVDARPYIMAGFYSYQTYDIRHLQNDCLLYGIGIDLRYEKVLWSNQLAGYSGYLNDGDHPMVFRSILRKIGRRFDFLLELQAGWRDYGYRSVHAGTSWKLPLHRQRSSHQ
jgi:hypothetical protein